MKNIKETRPQQSAVWLLTNKGLGSFVAFLGMPFQLQVRIRCCSTPNHSPDLRAQEDLGRLICEAIEAFPH